jgi:hypothetical protein
VGSVRALGTERGVCMRLCVVRARNVYVCTPPSSHASAFHAQRLRPSPQQAVPLDSGTTAFSGSRHERHCISIHVATNTIIIDILMYVYYDCAVLLLHCYEIQMI